jgi:hypothetical protein
MPKSKRKPFARKSKRKTRHDEIRKALTGLFPPPLIDLVVDYDSLTPGRLKELKNLWTTITADDLDKLDQTEKHELLTLFPDKLIPKQQRLHKPVNTILPDDEDGEYEPEPVFSDLVSYKRIFEAPVSVRSMLVSSGSIFLYWYFLDVSRLYSTMEFFLGPIQTSELHFDSFGLVPGEDFDSGSLEPFQYLIKLLRAHHRPTPTNPLAWHDLWVEVYLRLVEVPLPKMIAYWMTQKPDNVTISSVFSGDHFTTMTEDASPEKTRRIVDTMRTHFV